MTIVVDGSESLVFDVPKVHDKVGTSFTYKGAGIDDVATARTVDIVDVECASDVELGEVAAPMGVNFEAIRDSDELYFWVEISWTDGNVIFGGNRFVTGQKSCE